MVPARKRAIGRLLMPDRSLLAEIAWFNRLRFLAVVGIAVMTLMVEPLLGEQADPFPFWLLMTCTLAVNLVYVGIYSRLPKASPRLLRLHVGMQIGVDLCILTFLLHYSGGITNPLVLFYLFHTFIAALLLSGLGAVLVASTSLVLIAGLGYGEYWQIFSHYPMKVGLMNLPKASPAELAAWIVALGLVLGLSVYFISTLLRQLSAQEESMAGLSHQLARSEKLASIGTLAAGVSHEINNPIGVISNKTKILRYRISDRDPPEALLAELDSIDKHARRISVITEGLLAFARESDFELRPLHANDLIREAAALVKVPFERKRLDLRMELSAADPRLMGSANHLLQVLVNVLLNAKDASEDGAEVSISSEPIGEAVAIRIRDSGSGISLENLSQVFDPFFTTKDVGHGTGLGLAISHRLVERHHGRIEVDSQPEEGTVFSIVLPIHSAHPRSGWVSG